MRLERHILVELFFNFAFASAAIYFVASIFIVIQVFFAGNLPMLSAATVAPLLLLTRSELLTPCAFLLGVVFTYGRFSAELEYMATQACGIHPFRMLAPVVFMGLALTFVQWGILSYVMPTILVRADTIVDELALRGFEQIEPGRTELDAKGFYMSWARRSGMAFEDVVVDMKARVSGDGGNEELAIVRGHAERVEVVLEPSVIRFWLYGLQTGDRGYAPRIKRVSVTIPKDKLRDSSTFRPKPEFFTSDVLLALGIRMGHVAEQLRGAEEGSVEARGAKRARDESRRDLYAFQRRAAWSFAPLLLGLLGAPIAIWIRRGTRLSALVLAFGVFLLVYFPLAKIGGDALVDVESIPIGVCAWLATGVSGVLVGILNFRLARR